MTTSILIILMYTLIFEGGGELKDLSYEFIKTKLGENVNIEFEEFIIPPDLKKKIQGISRQAFFRDRVYIYRIFKNDKQTNLAILDNVVGKSLPITFLVLFDSGGDIINTVVLKYREPYGGAISEPLWLKQFTGKNLTSNFEIGNDISAISGATISVNSLTAGIFKLTLLHDSILKQ